MICKSWQKIGISAWLAPLVPFWPLSRSNLPKRTSPAWSAWLSPLLSLWWSVSAAQQPKSFKTDLASLLCLAVLPAPAGGPSLAAQQPKSSKTDLASFVCLAVLLALPLLVVRFGRSAARILQNGPRQLAMLGCALCTPSGGPFWPLSSPNPPKRTSAAQILQNGPRHLSLLGCAPCSPS